MGSGTVGDRQLLVLSTRRDSPGQRFRIRAWTPLLRSVGISPTEYAFSTPALDRLASEPDRRLAKAFHASAALIRYPLRFPRVGAFDGALVFRAAVPPGIPILERRTTSRLTVPLAFDIDDPIFLPPPRSPTPLARRAPTEWRTFCANAAVTLCINDAIADHVRPHCRRVEVVPNALDLERYPPHTHRSPEDGPMVIGYSGSSTTVEELLLVEQVLESIARDIPFELHLVGGRVPFRVGRATVREHRWSEERESELLNLFDIGIAPARDDEWNRYKSFVKVLLYMAVGLPVVASPVGFTPQVIQDGVNGFLASDREEWESKLRTLLGDPGLCASVGAAARRTVETEYSLDVHGPRIVSVFEDLLDDRA